MNEYEVCDIHNNVRIWYRNILSCPLCVAERLLENNIEAIEYLREQAKLKNDIIVDLKEELQKKERMINENRRSS